jgi:phage terminase large subunit
MDLDLTITEPQALFHQLNCKYPLFVGGFGSGKSEAMLNQAILDALEHPHAVIALFEPTYQLVEEIIVGRLMQKLEALGLEPNLKIVKKKILTGHPQCGTFILRTLDNPHKIRGYEAYKSHVDEIDILSLPKAREAWQMIIARNRQKLPGLKAPIRRVSAYSTPEGFNFTYDQWVTNANDNYKYVTAPTASNPFLADDYIQGLLDTYPEQLCKAYLQGEWVNLTTGQVYNAYKRDIQVSTEAVQGNETLFIGVDFNITKMAATLYVKRDKKEEVIKEGKTQVKITTIWHAVDEISDAYDTSSVLDILKERYPKNSKIFYPDSSGSQRKGMGKDVAESYIALIEQAGHQCRFNNTNPLVKDRVVSMNAALEKGFVKVNHVACPITAKCLEQQCYDKHGEPDKSKNTDHQNDATTYPIAYNFPVRKPLRRIQVDFKL